MISFKAVLVITVIGVAVKTTIIVKYARSLALNMLPERREIMSERRLKTEMARTIINTEGIVKNTIKFNLSGTFPSRRVLLKKLWEKRTVRKQRRV
jgi:hypothetical protein